MGLRHLWCVLSGRSEAFLFSGTWQAWESGSGRAQEEANNRWSRDVGSSHSIHFVAALSFWQDVRVVWGQRRNQVLFAAWYLCQPSRWPSGWMFCYCWNRCAFMYLAGQSSFKLQWCWCTVAWSFRWQAEKTQLVSHSLISQLEAVGVNGCETKP